MKLCIVTVYNSVNSGSFWQAKILGQILEKMGHEVFYLERKGGSTSLKYKIKSLLGTIKRRNFKDLINKSKEFYEFDKVTKKFKVIANNENDLKKIDCFILGSDTIWNIDSKYFAQNYKRYFGGLFSNKRVISYAASTGNTTIETLKKYDDIPDMLNKMKYISVRDEDTYTIIKQLCQKELSLVCDPTLLISKKEYEKLSNKINDNNYIFLYLFKDLSKNQSEELKQFAQENNLKIISGTNNYSCCDKCIVNAPQSFLNYMIKADYVITDTFHGAIFSTNLQKRFIAINRNKQKVNNFVKSVNLDERLVEMDSSIIELMRKPINYDNVNAKLMQLRENSLNYLNKAIN